MFPPPTTLVRALAMVLKRPPPWGAAEMAVRETDNNTKLLILDLFLVLGLATLIR